MSDQEAAALMYKYESGQCTDAEKAFVEKWLFQLNQEPNKWTDAGLAEIRAEVWQKLPQKTVYKRLNYRYAAVAALLIFISAGVYFFVQHKQQAQLIAGKNSIIQPGSNKAILTLSDGKKINLNNVKNGQLANQPGVSVFKSKSGKIVYTISADQHSGAMPSGYNLVETPMGGQYEVDLPDGSRVWLNAASSLRYPIQFSGKDRTVELAGEGYFEIAHNAAKPFRVISNNQIVEVLGTHFNINSYQNEPGTKTTLLQGSVKIIAGGKQKLLKPDQQSVTNAAGITLANVNVKHEVTWKNGYFRFDNEHIESIMRKLSRWYNISIKYEGTHSDEGFYGKISRYKPIEDVLAVLEKTNGVHFKIEGREVTVLK